MQIRLPERLNLVKDKICNKEARKICINKAAASTLRNELKEVKKMWNRRVFLISNSKSTRDTRSSSKLSLCLRVISGSQKHLITSARKSGNAFCVFLD